MIEVRDCSKAFGSVKAVNKATLTIGDREVFGLVGSNGAGKSTLLRLMAGIIRPDAGEIWCVFTGIFIRIFGSNCFTN